jgi:murein DD-endopeptidase MepM/ murein hydrolase activator NlpD
VVDHGDFIARYGEVQHHAFVKTGDHVEAGQIIAKVGHLVGINVPSDMLHLELYDKSCHGALTQPAATSLKPTDGIPFLRRYDLVDPSSDLDSWSRNLPEPCSA